MESNIRNELFSPVSTDPPTEARGVGLAPVAVRPDAQSHGIGSKLVREGCASVRNLTLIIVLSSALRNTMNASDFRKRVRLVYAMNMGLMTSL